MEVGEMKLSDHEPKRYYLALDLPWEEPEWKDVAKEYYIQVERNAGFRSKFGPGHIAAAAFNGNGVRGMVEY